MSTYDATIVSGNTRQLPGACPWCSSSHSGVVHGGPCPRVRAIEYHPSGGVKRVEFFGDQTDASAEKRRPT